jgi:hypothetical protein
MGRSIAVTFPVWADNLLLPFEKVGVYKLLFAGIWEGDNYNRATNR